jgi:hypothetical protein
MKKYAVLAVFMTATFLATATRSYAQDVSGVWEVSFDTPKTESGDARTITFCVTFAQDGMVLTGNARPFMDSSGSDICKAQDLANVDLQNVSNGMIHGDHIMFTLVPAVPREMAFMGNVDGDNITGTLETPQSAQGGMSLTWIGKRIKD